ncbi:hypothetical protein [Streptomyces melanogenes]|uniref:hypothetical protein n=1 Tax=Streptomyces melanogenes TaxID=67326 RepID=UPI00167C7A62|nr:hypothetical protein [Streptomyces melanogenes]
MFSTAVAGTALIAAVAPAAQAVDLEGALGNTTHALPVPSAPNGQTTEGLGEQGLHKGLHKRIDMVHDTLAKGAGLVGSNGLLK